MLFPEGNAVSPADKKFDPQELEALARELVGPIITEAQRALDERVVENAQFHLPMLCPQHAAPCHVLPEGLRCGTCGRVTSASRRERRVGSPRPEGEQDLSQARLRQLDVV